MTLFVGYTQVAATATNALWYLAALRAAFLMAGVLFIMAVFGYLALLCKRYLNALEILDDVRCTYWTSEGILKVTLWFRDYSDSPTFAAGCTAQFNQQVIELSEGVNIGGSYLGRSGLKSGRDQPMMIEFTKHNIAVQDTTAATLAISIKPATGVWASKCKNKVVPVQVIIR